MTPCNRRAVHGCTAALGGRTYRVRAVAYPVTVSPTVGVCEERTWHVYRIDAARVACQAGGCSLMLDASSSAREPS